MLPRKLTPALEQALREQVITADQPGSILHDFGVILDALGQNGVEAGGKYNLIPIKLIGELDRRLSRPLELKLKRPQIRSHPYLQALNLLLRASGLGRVEGAGDKARLGLDPAMKMQWDQLNPTEQYFNLLEAAFRFGRAEMVGSRIDPGKGCFRVVCSNGGIPRSGVEKFDYKEDTGRLPDRSGSELAPAGADGPLRAHGGRAAGGQVETWQPAGLRHVPFGDAMMTLLAAKTLRLP